jgi:hypothetical protein
MGRELAKKSNNIIFLALFVTGRQHAYNVVRIIK